MRESKQAQSGGAQPAKTYQLKIVVCYIKPLIWRRLRLPGDSNLGFLHAAIQVALGWTNSHLHQFVINDRYYSDPNFHLDYDSESPVLDEGAATLLEVAPRVKDAFLYEYDFGDSWEHWIKVEKISAPDPALGRGAECSDGRRAGPPDTCGGPAGYADLLAVIRDPEHEEYDDMMEWLGGGFDPKAFDREKVNRYLRKLKWPRVTVDQLARVLMQRDNYKGY